MHPDLSYSACPRLFAFGLVLGLAWTAQGQSQSLPRSGRAIQFSEPRSEVTTTNLERETSQKNTLQSLDADLKKPFEVFGSQSSLDGVFTPPVHSSPSPVLRSKKSKDALDKKRNWVFNTEAEMYGLKTPEEILKLRKYGPDGEEEKDTTSLERFWDRLERKPGVTNDANGNRVFSAQAKSE